MQAASIGTYVYIHTHLYANLRVEKKCSWRAVEDWGLSI